MKKTPPLFTDLDSLPVVLTMKEIAGLYRISTATVRRGLALGVFSPQPFEHYPYRWKKEDVIADLKRPRAHTPRPHGPRARLRPAKASIASSTPTPSTARPVAR